MKKIIMLLVATFFLVSCSNSNTNVDNENKELISEVFKNFQNDFENIKKSNYENLIFADFQPIFPNINECNDLTMHNDEMNIKESYDIFVKQVKKIAPWHKFDEKNIYFSPKDSKEYKCCANGYPRVIDYKDMLFDGSVETWWWLYESDAESKSENDVYLWLDTSTFFGVMNKGKGKEVCYPEGFEHINVWESDEYETIKAAYLSNNLPNESHTMADNKNLTIIEAVSLTENFFSDYKPEEIKSEVETYVVGVEVREQNNVEGYRMFLANRYNDIPFDYEHDVNFITGDDDRITQNATAFIANSNEIDYFYNLQNWNNIEKSDNTIDAIIPLNSAIQKVSETLTSNVKFEIRDIKFVYALKGDALAYVTASPSWKITAYNTNDEKEYQVYVNAENGEVSCYATW